MRLDKIIQSSVLSEKAYTSADKNIYVLKVALKATKLQVKHAVQTTFGVDVLDVKTAITRGKVVRKARSKKGGAVEVKLPNVKKAFVKLKAGQQISVITTQLPEEGGEVK
jgi:large subunit ribosomal protein L23